MISSIDDMIESLASSSVDLGNERACAEHLHISGFREMSRVKEPAWSEMLDAARSLRAKMRSDRPSIAEFAAAVLCIFAVWGWMIVQGPVS